MISHTQNIQQERVFIELTNPVHGGIGWDFGACLWSPARDKGERDSWALMRKVQRGDKIIHLLKTDNTGYFFVGVSLAESECEVISSEPPIPDRWANMVPYYRVPLCNYVPLKKKISVERFYKEYYSRIKDIHGSFFVNYNNQIRTAQKYLATVPADLYLCLEEFLNENGFEFAIDEPIPSITDNEPAQLDISPPGTVQTIVIRKIRDTKIVRELKEECDYRCQICGRRIVLPNGKFYAEGHHLMPLGGNHNGPDIKENIIILCPYHHAEFDYCSIAINPETMIIEHIDHSEYCDGSPVAYQRSNLLKTYIDYHYNLFDVSKNINP